jgi:hypothetical protein
VYRSSEVSSTAVEMTRKTIRAARDGEII